MQRPTRTTARRALLLGASALIATLSCGRDVTGPAGGVQVMRGFTFEARFDQSGLANGVASDLVPYTRVRVLLVTQSGRTAVDQIVDFPSNSDSVRLALNVPLSGDAPAAGELMDLSLAFINAAGDTVFRGGPLPVTVVAGSPGANGPPPPQVPVTYTGPGATATSVTISAALDTILSGNPFTYTAIARDAQSNVIAAPIAWRTSNVAKATVTAPGAGAGTTLPARGPVFVIAQLLTGQADTVAVEILPRAQSLIVSSGNNQVATFNTALAQPLVAQVNATDGLGMAGVNVAWAVGTGGGGLAGSTTTTDANGRVQTNWTAGSGLGAQTVTATSAGLTGSPLTFTAMAPTFEMLHAYSMAAGVTDAIGGVNGTLNGGATVANGALTLDGTSGYVSFAQNLIPATGSFTLSFWLRNRTTGRIAEWISQGATLAGGFYVGTDATGQIRVSDDWMATGVQAPPVDGLFHHVAITADSAGAATRLYIDGTLRATLPQRVPGGPTGTFTRFGRQFDPYTEYTDGDLDEVKLARGVLTAAEVAAIRAAGVSTPDRLVFSQQPTNVAAGTAIAPAVTVRVEDATGQLRAGSTSAVTVALTTNPGGSTLGGTLTVNAVAGIATFANLTLDRVASGYRLGATAAGATPATSGTFNVSAGAATQLVFTASPALATATVPMSPAITVQARDAQGNPRTDYTGAVTLAIGTNPGGGTIGGTTTVNAVAGTASFTNITISAVGTGYTLTASATGLATATTTPFDVTAGVPAYLEFTQQPTVGDAGINFNTPFLVVTAHAIGGAVATGFTGPVTISIQSGAGTLGGTLTVNAVAGQANFTNVFATTAQAQLSLRAQAAGFLADTTDWITVNHGFPARTAFVTPPSSGALAGQAITPPIQVRVEDAYGNWVPEWTTPITLSFRTNPSGATLGGQVSVVPTAGIATFPNVTVSLPGAGYDLFAASTGVTSTFSPPFSVAAGVFANSWASASGGNWSAPGNWTLGRVPNPTDTVVIANAGTFTVVMDVNATVAFLILGGASGTQTLSMGTRSLTVDSLASIGATGVLTVGSGAVQGNGALFNQGQVVLTGSSLTVATVANAGTLQLQGTPTVTTTALSNTGTMRILGDATGGNASVAILNDWTNAGLLELTTQNAGYSVGLTMTGATLTNSVAGTISVLAGTGGTRTLAVELDNQGELDINQSTTLGRASAVTTNPGAINVLGAATLTYALSGTSPSFTNSGNIVLGNARTLTFSGTGTVDLLSGFVLGGGGFVTTAGAVNLLVTSSNLQPRLTVAAASLLASPFVIPPGDSLRIYGGTFDPPSLTNQGLLILEGNPTLTTALSTAPGSTILVRGSGTTGNATPTFANGFTNDGAIQVTTENAGYTANLSVTNGALTNSPSGTITALAGSGGPRTIAVQLNNLGTVTANTALAINRPSANHVNAGTISLAAGDITVTQTGTTPSFTNTGTITVPSGRTLTVSGGALDLTAGLVSGFDGYLVTTGSPTVRFLNGTVQPRKQFAAGTVFPDAFVVPAGDSLRLIGGVFAPPTLTNNGLLVLESTTTITTAFTTAAGSTIRVRGDGVGGNATPTFIGGLTNSAAIELTAENAGYSASLLISGAPLVNTATGTITALLGSGGARTIGAVLQNQGVVTINQALLLSQPSAAHVNLGTIALAAGNLTISQSGTSPSFTNGGTISLQNGRTLTNTDGLLDLAGGIVTGYGGFLQTTGAPAVLFTTPTVQPRITFSAGTVVPNPFTIAPSDSLRLLGGTFAPPSLVNNGLLLLEGATTVTTAVTTGTGSRIRVRGDATGGNATPTFTNGFTNSANIELMTENAGYTASLTVATGTLVNGPTGDISSLPGSGGARTLAAQLDNQGMVQVGQALTLARADAAHTNSGTLLLGTADLTVSQTGTGPSFTNTGTIAIGAGRTFTNAGGTLTLTSGLVSGFGGYFVTTGAPTVRFTTGTMQPRVQLSAGTILPDAFTIPNGDSLRLIGGSFAPPSLQNDGLLVLENTVAVTTAYTTGPLGVTRVRGDAPGGNANATFTNPFTNNGLVELTTENAGYQSNLIVTNGTFVNAPGATFLVAAGAGGARTLSAQLDNQGALQVNLAFTLNRASSTHVNSGTITLAGTGDFTINQTGTTPSFTNSGTVVVPTGRTLTIAGGAINLTPGLVSGYGGYFATTGAPTLDFTTASVQPRITLSATTVIPTGFTIPASDSLRLIGGTFAPPTLTNNGILLLEGSTTVTTALTTGTGSTILVRGDGTGGNSLPTFTNGFTNTANIVLTTENAGYQSVLTVANGTLVNTGPGVISVNAGSGGARTLAAQLDNQSSVVINQDLVLSRASAAHLNSGTITVNANADFTVSQTGTAPSFTNTGTIALTPNRVFTNAGGTLDLTAGQVTGTAGFFVTTGAPTVRFLASSMQPRVNLSATTVLPDPFTIAATDSLRIYNGTFAPPSLVNNGLLTLEGPVTLTTALTANAGSTIRARGLATTGNGTPTITNAFTNHGALELATENAGYAVSITVPTGTVVNATDGTILSAAGSGGTRTLAFELNNQGVVTTNINTTLGRASAAQLNTGTINVNAGTLVVSQSGTAPTFTNAGVVALAGASVLNITGGSADVTSGSITGYAGTLSTTGTTSLLLSSSNLQPRVSPSAGTTLPQVVTIGASDSLRIAAGTFAPTALINSGTLVLEGTTTLNTAVTSNPGSLILARGDGSYGNAVITVSNGFTLGGTLRLTSEDAGYNEVVNFGTNTLTIAAGGLLTFDAGSSGGRTLTAGLIDNSGTVTVNLNTTVNANVEQRNQLTVGSTRTLTINGALTLFTGSNSVATGGTLNRTSCTINGSPTFTGFACP